MSFVIQTQKEKISVKYSKKKVPAPNFLSETETEVGILTGELYGKHTEFLFSNWEENDEILINSQDSYSMVKVKKEKREIWFASSRFGLEHLFYYCHNNDFIISDNYWEVVNFVEPTFQNIDVESIKEMGNLPYALFDGTFVKDIKILNPSCVGCFSLENSKLKINTYWNFRYRPEKELSVEKAAQNLDECLDKAFQKIKGECGDVKYAVGLSGGLDSRIIPYYAKKNGMKMESFILGAKRPHKFFISRDHKNARLLSEIYGINHHEVEWRRETLRDKISLDVKNYPIGRPQIFTFEYMKDFDFDVLITGGNGLVVGSTLPEDVNEVSDKKLIEYMWNLSRTFYPSTITSRRVEKAIAILFGKKVRLSNNRTRKWFNEIIDDTTLKRIETKFQYYINEERSKGKNNLDIYEGYFNDLLGSRNRIGGFESLCGTKRSFSIYVPYVYDETLKWNLDLLIGRPVLKQLICTKMERAAEVKEQNYESSLKEKNSVIHRGINMLIFLLRGNGTAMEQKYFKKCRNEFITDMKNNSEWFFKVFDIKENLNEISKWDDIRFIIKMWKIKKVVEVIETKEYKKNIEQEFQFDVTI